MVPHMLVRATVKAEEGEERLCRPNKPRQEPKAIYQSQHIINRTDYCVWSDKISKPLKKKRFQFLALPNLRVPESVNFYSANVILVNGSVNTAYK